MIEDYGTPRYATIFWHVAYAPAMTPKERWKRQRSRERFIKRYPDREPPILWA